MQTSILLDLFVVGNMPEMPESKVRDLDYQTTVQHTVGTLQTTVKLQRTFVKIFHSLTISNTHRKDVNYILITARVAWGGPYCY